MPVAGLCGVEVRKLCWAVSWCCEIECSILRARIMIYGQRSPGVLSCYFAKRRRVRGVAGATEVARMRGPKLLEILNSAAIARGKACRKQGALDVVIVSEYAL